MFAGSLIRQFRELSDQLLEDGAHIRVAGPVGVQVDLAELLGNEVKQVGAGESGDLRLQLKPGGDIFDIGRKAVQLRRQIGGDVVLVADYGLHVHW